MIDTVKSVDGCGWMSQMSTTKSRSSSETGMSYGRRPRSRTWSGSGESGFAVYAPMKDDSFFSNYDVFAGLIGLVSHLGFVVVVPR